MAIQSIEVTLNVDYGDDDLAFLFDLVFNDIYNAGWSLEPLEFYLLEKFKSVDNWDLKQVDDYGVIYCTFDYTGKGAPDIGKLSVLFNQLIIEFRKLYQIDYLYTLDNNFTQSMLAETIPGRVHKWRNVRDYLILRATRHNAEYQRFL